LDYLNFDFLDFLDIILVAVLLYYVYRLIKGTVAINIFLGIAIIYLIWKLTEALQMELLSDILGKFIGGGFIALIIVFQQEIRKFLLMLGSTNFTSKKSFLRQLSFLKSDILEIVNVDAILEACKEMSDNKTGALIVIKRNNSLDFIKDTGDLMNAEVNKPILKSIFFKNSPLHDGAVIIEDNKIVATRVILPIAKEANIPLRFGLRHRAAIGITDKTDALALVVSEETGEISYVKDGEFVLYKNLDELNAKIRQDLAV